jgi:hypothetical protein
MNIAAKLVLIAENEQKVYNAGYEKGRMESIGRVECARPHIIEVDELPTENIDESAVYKIVSKTLVDVVVYDEGRIVSFGSAFSAGYLAGSFHIIPTKTVDGVLISDEAVHLYYIEDEHNIFCYGDMDESGTNAWWVGSDLLEGIPYNGEILNVSEATRFGYYAILGEPANLYRYCATAAGFSDIIFDGRSAAHVAATEGALVSFNQVATKPTEDILVTNIDKGIWHCYYIEDETSIFVYLDEGWLNLATYFGGSYMGTVTDISEVTSYGIYAVISDGWTEYIKPTGALTIRENGMHNISTKNTVLVDVEIPDGYIYPCGELQITENGTYDVRYSESAAVEVPSSYIVQTVEKLPTDAFNGSFAIVLGGV